MVIPSMLAQRGAERTGYFQAGAVPTTYGCTRAAAWRCRDYQNRGRPVPEQTLREAAELARHLLLAGARRSCGWIDIARRTQVRPHPNGPLAW